MNSRRNILALAPFVFLAGCQTGATTQTTVQVDANLIAAGVTAVAPAIEADPKLSADDRATIKSAVATVQQANSVIQGAVVAPGGAVQQIAMAIRMLAPAALGVLDPSSPQAIAINAAVALLPVLLQAAGLPPAAMAMAHPGKMSPAEARLVLTGAAVRK